MRLCFLVELVALLFSGFDSTITATTVTTTTTTSATTTATIVINSTVAFWLTRIACVVY